MTLTPQFPNRTLGQQFFDDERKRREERAGTSPEADLPGYHQGERADEFKEAVDARQEEMEEEMLEDREAEEYREIQKVLKRTGEKPFTIKILKQRLAEIDEAREQRRLAKEEELETIENERIEAQEQAWQEQQAKVQEEQKKEAEVRKQEADEHEVFKADRIQKAIAKAEADAELELGFGLSDAFRCACRNLGTLQ